jgi:asparagine synthase (glutamine-hydrolysing)
MCGIAGEVRWDGGTPEAVGEPLATLRHRGPDAEGVYEGDSGWVGQTRLSIIDLVTGDPPIASEDGTVGVAFNGEVYNYREIRDELRARGHTFATDGDTEVIAHLAEDAEPTEVAARLDGMFGVAILDRGRGRLTLARDRFGKKPLYYFHDDRRLVFGSELKAVFAHPGVPRRLREGAIPDYLTFGYVPTPETFFEGVRSVPPGHVLVADGPEDVRIEPYWEPRFPGALGNGPAPLDLGPEEAARRVRDGLRAAVERRLISDVPLGAFLSGGIDSSAVVALMAQAGGGPVATFTIGFEDTEGFDERPYARAVAQRYGTDHTEFVVQPHAAELVERLVEHYDQPFGDSSSLPTYLLCEQTAGHVKVALSGDGGDELFAGYERFAAALFLARAQVVPQPLRAGVRRMAELAGPFARSGRLAKARRALLRSDLGPEMGLLDWISYVPADAKARLLGDPSSAGVREYARLWEASAGAHTLDRLLDLNLRTYLVDDLLPKVDRMSMAHALEVRCPFLDRELAELAFRLDPRLRVRGMSLKRVLKAAVADLLPPELLDRPKRGFGIPLARWFRTDLAPLVAGTLGAPDSRVARYVSGDALRAMVDEHARGAADHGNALWTLLTLEVFLRREGW